MMAALPIMAPVLGPLRNTVTRLMMRALCCGLPRRIALQAAQCFVIVMRVHGLPTSRQRRMPAPLRRILVAHGAQYSHGSKRLSAFSGLMLGYTSPVLTIGSTPMTAGKAHRGMPSQARKSKKGAPSKQLLTAGLLMASSEAR